MPCPYFYPVQAQRVRHKLFPLGDCWGGVCSAMAGEPSHPAEALLSSVCNMGYARGRCSRFPAEAGADAVRFTVRSDNASCVRICYVLERDHHPFAHGLMEYSRGRRALVEPPGDRNLERQAMAYIESYLRRTSDLERV